jgi:hypothetical protein
MLVLSFLAIWANAEQPPPVQVLEVQEIKDEGDDEGAGRVALSEVEKARQITDDRIYGLIGLWALIILGVFIVRYQVRDDERLYREGYYNKKLE